MKPYNASDVRNQSVVQLGLRPDVHTFASPEWIAAALRRAASLMCPCPERTLVQSVAQPLRGICEESDQIEQEIEGMLEKLVAHGDVLEFRADLGSPSPRAVLHGAPPSFLMIRDMRKAFLIGIAPGQRSALPDYLEKRVEYRGHLRILVQKDGENLHAELGRLGLHELSIDAWQRSPAACQAEDIVRRREQLLDSAQPSGLIPGLRILDCSRDPLMYRARWCDPGSQTGSYVARRPRTYGADVWCYVRLREGRLERLVDFPDVGSVWRGCDEAWHFQMAVDFVRGHPQRYRETNGLEDTVVLEFYSPIPSWAERRWSLIGEREKDKFIAYKIKRARLPAEYQFMREFLWLEKYVPRSI